MQLFCGLPVQLAAQVGQLVVEELDDVEVIEDEDGLGQMRLDGTDIGRRHVDGHGFDLRPGSVGAVSRRV